MTKNERVEKVRIEVKKNIDDAYLNLEDAVKNNIKRIFEQNINEIILKHLGLDKAYFDDTPTVTRGSPLLNRIQDIVKDMLPEIISKLEPMELSPNQIKTIQREYDRAYFNHIKEIASIRGREKARKDMEDVYFIENINLD